MNLCSNGESVSNGVINRKRTQSYADHFEIDPICECCGNEPSVDHDHTISQKRCKELGKTELIWDRSNWVYSCRSCHNQWESYKSGECKNHKNYPQRMEFVKQHDPEGYNKRKYL